MLTSRFWCSIKLISMSIWKFFNEKLLIDSYTFFGKILNLKGHPIKKSRLKFTPEIGQNLRDFFLTKLDKI